MNQVGDVDADHLWLLLLRDILPGSNPTRWTVHTQILITKEQGQSIRSNSEVNTKNKVF